MPRIITGSFTASEVIIDAEDGTVTKTYKKGPMYLTSMQREIYWLQKLHDTGITPQLILVRHNAILMTYEGEQITKTTVPANWQKQIDDIAEILKKNGCCHNDIKPSDILVKDGRLKLVDFGWATKAGEEIPEHWPPDLGQAFSLGKHKFDDAYSLEQSLIHVLYLEKLIW